jgi:hypothetical protein
MSLENYSLLRRKPAATIKREAIPPPSYYIPSNTGFNRRQALIIKLDIIKKPITVKAANSIVLYLKITV